MDHSPTFALSIDSIAADSVEQSNRIEWVGGGRIGGLQWLDQVYWVQV